MNYWKRIFEIKIKNSNNNNNNNGKITEKVTKMIKTTFIYKTVIYWI